MDLSLKKELKKAARSSIITITNNTTETLFLTKHRLISGKWSKFPAELVDPNQSITFATESYGLLTGTEGEIEFKMWEDQIPIKFVWLNPFFGSSSAEGSCGDGFKINKTEILGSFMDVHFIVEDPYIENRQDFKTIRMTPTIIDQWIVDLMNAKKSVLIQISNTTDYTLQLETQNLTHGIFRQFPPEAIEPGASKNFGAENHGLNGTEGEVKYSVSIKKGDSIHTCILQIFWKVPLIAEPKFSSKIFTMNTTCTKNKHWTLDLHFSSDESYFLETEFLKPYENDECNTVQQ